ncbi:MULTISPECIES: RagB/SusD family nutrient uptake outer membrane protein [Mesonia]|uniref:Uncharacterized protein n=1 Tax=Mesonia oceanica TaxID=2687242 RepID=A0AC61Y6E3_9FLAO|nr:MULTISPECIES: RagB/SusD family nutrient uptake outer membrane protein [Mesonia]MAN27282.1 RagB/SusD family nutrient uptake outer membrane protein [Mesonia sp.]MAQ42322.1 RagB/SusD family nutrient uptake outer membrane protein [Mesonia sp.]MBJ98610.1 RagB/SusD family nutrient uptake outer membrane protein [Flavobacteriaceae bacterium]VVU99972.1 hypothetical protein FVB9532_01234 [Mesonia oceanica]|tara:strand:+ start:49570 stop:51051 length:1482 start_codon:yes stop_codon:yes gene_type:complete
MKNIKLIFPLIGLILLTSCEDYLSETPDNRTVIDSEEKIKELLVGAYPTNAYAPFLEPMTDNYGDKGNLEETTDDYLKSYSWEPVINDQQDTPIGFWSETYSAIAQANQALASISELEGGESDLSGEKGEGLLARAYGHFMLANIWGEHYDPQTAASNLAIPYVLEPETEAIKQYSRATVEEVYNLIEKDIEEGLPLLENDYSQPDYHFTPAAGFAFASRFYLYKGDWDKVIEYSSEILNNADERIRDWEYYVDNLQISQIGAEVMSPSEPSNLLIVVPVSNIYEDFAINRFGLTENKKEELFDASNPYGKDWAYQVVFFSNGGLTNTINKYDFIFEYTDITAGIGYRRTSVALLTHDESLLARAEAYAMKNDFAAAVQDINAFLSNKTRNYNPVTDQLTEEDILNEYPNAEEYNPYYSLTENQASFVKFIAEMRRREFYMEGLRWFDIKRFHIPVTHDFIDKPTDILTDNDNRRLLQIPPSAVSFGLQQNPR